MNKAFTKENDDAPETAPQGPVFSLPPGIKNYLTPEGAQRLRDERKTMAQRIDRAWRLAAGRAPAFALVEIDELHALGQWREGGLEAGVVAARPAMDQESHRALAHPCAIGDEPHSFDVEEEFGATDRRSHSCPFQIGRAHV